MPRLVSFAQIAWCLLGAGLGCACGGAFARSDGAQAGTASGGNTGAAGDGASGGATSGPGSCTVDGRSYADNALFPSSDGCNTCTCQADGSTACTQRACGNSCASVSEEYAQAIGPAKSCQPDRPNQCTKLVAGGLPCGCPTFVNAEQADALSLLTSIDNKFVALSCSENVSCPACFLPTTGSCSAQGQCQDGSGAPSPACKVGGVIYLSGADGIADPISCNKCSCYGGHLSCTEINCPIACPAGTAFGTQCARCGPTDACQTIESACLPTCTSTCKSGACSNGLCRMICG